MMRPEQGFRHREVSTLVLFIHSNSSNDEQTENGEHAEESVIHDITGTTVYVVGVICVIPAAGLVAWVVRYVVKKKVFICSKAFINRPDVLHVYLLTRTAKI